METTNQKPCQCEKTSCGCAATKVERCHCGDDCNCARSCNCERGCRCVTAK